MIKGAANDIEEQQSIYIADQAEPTADLLNDPGKSTAFIGFEWSSIPDGNNLHCVVVLRDCTERASQVVPISGLPPPAGSTKPRDLWKWMQAYENNTGGQAFALAHNGNLSSGRMFLLDKTLATG